MTSSHRYAPSSSGGAILALLLAVGAALLGAAPAAAQTGSVGGVVVEEDTGRPLAGAQVVVVGTSQGTISGQEGRFLITGVDGTEVQLRISMLGFASVTRTARVGDLSLRIGLSPDAIQLDQIVVTGTAGQQTKRALGNTVTILDAAEIVDKAPVNSMAELLNGRSPGVAIIHTTGMIGGGHRVRIRGSSSFSLSNEPLVYIDGVRVNNAQATGPISQAFGSRPISRWNDINTEDIESVEIIKGPAAATLYGTEASNGVIQIITKRGRAGGMQFNLSVKQGASWWDPEEDLWTNYFDVGNDGTIESIDIVELENERLGTCTRAADDFFTACPVRPIWRTGHLQQYDLSASGGSDAVRYYFSGGYENSTGVDYDNARKQYNGRLNLTATPSEKVDLSGSIGYTTGRTNLGLEAGGGGATWTTFFARPDQLGTARRGFWSWTPETYEDLMDIYQDVERTTLSFTARHRPVGWFDHRLNIGRDFTREQDVELMHHDQRYLDLTSFADRGYKEMWDRSTAYTSLDYAGTFRFPVNADIETNTSVGGQVYRRESGFIYAYGEGFPVPGLTSMSATTQRRVNSEGRVENVTVGAFLQEQVSWRNRVFVTAAIRADDNSAFGDEFDFVTYPKLSAAWVVSEEPFWSFRPLSTVKLRAAYGQSGQQPDAFVALRTFNPAPGPGGTGTVTPANLGNPDLGPERGSEFEIGFDAGLLDDRVSLEFTYYNQRTTDAILLREIAPSTGFSGNQFVNAGEITNTGIEFLVRGDAWRTDRHGLELQFNLGTNDNEVVSLGDITDEDFISSGTYNRHQIGYPVGSWFGQKLVSAELDANGNAINVMCDNGEGGTVACGSAPRVYLGRTTPKVEGGVNATLRLFERFRLFGQLDFKTGFHKLDGNMRVRCWFFVQCEENWFPERFDPVLIAGIQDGYVDVLVDEADFAKLREVSLAYMVPNAWATRFGASTATISVAGRNVATWTKFGGLEPESSFNAGGRGGNVLWEQNVLPQLHQFVATINVTF
ncbi:MAG TPA: SusC/RagA family TonB-linked outer membrane protein [Longimicrobiales bacterium]|nr:SusC/RagA family TonB-linked outer membrane protein [Longimicrobiales bacterium]